MGEPFFGEGANDKGRWFPEDANDTQRLFRESIIQFTQEVMAPAEVGLDQHDYTIARAVFRQCADLGVFAAELDESDGGLGVGVIDATIMSEGIGHGNSLSVGLMVHQGVGMLPVACFGDGAQRAAYLPSAAAGVCIMGFALTEPHCGSDALALSTIATPTGEGYLLNGAKQFITNGAYAGCFITFARIPDVGITAFLVDAGAPGLRIGPEEVKLGQHASSTTSVIYENVPVDGSKVLGQPGQGHKIALNMLNLGRLKLAAACVGKMKALLPQALAYTNERTAFGQAISSFGLVRDRLARMGATLYAVESAVYRVASVMEDALSSVRGDEPGLSGVDRLKVLQDFALECALVKSLATEALSMFTDDMLQLYGGYGFSEEYPAAKAFRDARVTRLYEGTTEICRLNVMQRLLTHCTEGGGPASDCPVQQQKALMQQLMRVHLRENGGDVKSLLQAQHLTGTFAEMAERIYAGESALLRAKKHHDRGQQSMADYFVALSTSENLAAVHRIVGHLRAPDEEGDLWDHPGFRPVDTVAVRDQVIDVLQKGTLFDH